MLLILVPLMPNLPLATTVLLLRFSISQMDVPTRQSPRVLIRGAFGDVISSSPPPVGLRVADRDVLRYNGTMKMMIKRPGVFGAAAFALTVGIARFVSHGWPRRFHVQLAPGVHLHHYVFGIFALTVAGYLALVFKGPRATFGIALLYGLGVGLMYDEFGFWINPPLARGARWDYTGLLIVGAAFVIVALLRTVARRRRASSVELPSPASR